VPVEVSGISNVTSIATGISHACVATSGSPQCWGYNNNGQLGNGTTTNSSSPVQVSGITAGTNALTAGGTHTCIVLNDKTVDCWGSNTNGELGNGTSVARLAPVPVDGLTSVVGLSSGSYFTCALNSSGKVYCWGQNSTGQLGNGTTSDGLKPTLVLGF
jgi:alpha-tubulin suppressor-like RCC1 family protein